MTIGESFIGGNLFSCAGFDKAAKRPELRHGYSIETWLACFGPRLYHSGFRQPIARTTLADANEKHDWRIFADFAQVLIQQATALYAGDPSGVELQAAAALDSTTIDLCLALFPWAKFRRHKPAIKLHRLLSLQGNFPTVVTTGFYAWLDYPAPLRHIGYRDPKTG